MQTFYVKFRGYRSGVSRVVSQWNVSLKAKNPAAAVLELYKTHSGIGVLDITTKPKDAGDYIQHSKYIEWDEDHAQIAYA